MHVRHECASYFIFLRSCSTALYCSYAAVLSSNDKLQIYVCNRISYRGSHRLVLRYCLSCLLRAVFFEFVLSLLPGQTRAGIAIILSFHPIKLTAGALHHS